MKVLGLSNVFCGRLEIQPLHTAKGKEQKKYGVGELPLRETPFKPFVVASATYLPPLRNLQRNLGNHVQNFIWDVLCTMRSLHENPAQKIARPALLRECKEVSEPLNQLLTTFLTIWTVAAKKRPVSGTRNEIACKDLTQKVDKS